jgi:TusA-related sulfurtransferase
LARGYALTRGKLEKGDEIEIVTSDRIAKADIKEVKERENG